MGLGAPKRRNKLSHDPNNTAWTRATDNYGHKILARQGWTPGSYLGATDASHAEHYTAANASHIRVLLREDNLGLGAQVGKTNAETFGLSLFSGVLGRLNGKSESELQKQQDIFRDLELRTYQERKYGVVGFVSGGFLVGDRIQRTKEEATQDVGNLKQEKRVLKREADDDVETKIHVKKVKQEHKEDLVIKSEPQPGDEAAAMPPRKKRKEKVSRTPTSAIPDSGISSESNENQDERAARKLAKADKRARKEARRQRREERAARKSKRKEEAKKATSASDSDSSTLEEAEPAPVSRPPVMSGRQAVRHRYIMQKRMASMDAQAMKEIFMMKAAG